MVLAELRKALAESRVTQTEIGTALGIKQSAVSSLMSGRSKLSFEQFLTLADLLNLKPQLLLQNVQNRLTQVVPLTAEQERVLYKSDLNLMIYCTCVRETAPKDVEIHGYTALQIRKGFEELTEAGFLVKKQDLFVQKNPEVTYQASSRLSGSRTHQTIVRRSWDRFDRKYADKSFIATKFHAYLLDRFSISQTKEIEAAMWTVYEKIQLFRSQNSANGYTDDHHMPLWNIHLMLMTPMEHDS